MYSNGTQVPWFMHYKRLGSPNLASIDAKTLVIDLTSIFILISNLRDKKNAKCKSPFQPM